MQGKIHVKSLTAPPPLPPVVLSGGGNGIIKHVLRLLTRYTPNGLKYTNKKIR